MENTQELFPLTPTAEQRSALADNIIAVFNRATPMEWARGMSWYKTASDLALMVGDGDVVRGAGVIAALSANVGWTQNERMAREMAATGVTNGLSVGIQKASRILEGEPPSQVIGENARKTLSFFHNIAYPETSRGVTIDRHAHDIARNERWGARDRGLSTERRYNIFADAYRAAAARIGGGILPSQVQAVTWVVWTENDVPSRYRRSID